MVERRLKIALVIPAYNEGQVIGAVISDLISLFKKTKYDLKIIVIDDASKDETTLRAGKKGAFVIRHILNSGSGGATATGLSYAQQNDFDIAATLDADGQHSPQDVLSGIEFIQQAKLDLVIGSRLIDGQGMSKVKRLGNKA